MWGIMTAIHRYNKVLSTSKSLWLFSSSGFDNPSDPKTAIDVVRQRLAGWIGLEPLPGKRGC